MELKTRRTILTGSLALTFMVLLTATSVVPAAAQPVASVEMSGGNISWSPMVSYGRLVLTVSGQGRHYTKTFDRGAVNFSIVQADGYLPDGNYTWQLVAEPVSGRSRDNDAGAPLPRFAQSGYFNVSQGSLVDTNASEAAAGVSEDGKGSPFQEDQQILDDLIVVGSICVGQDCVNGESFGFDTLRLKENNLRIKFQDTSNSASFPTNDWQLTANDSSNGGANKFSIDDIDGGRTPFTIEASAPSHSLYVDDGGRLGLGTSTPVVDVHVKSGNTPTLRLEQDGSSGFTPQTWDVAGNEANFFVRDATNGSALPFKIFPGAPSNALTVEATTGDVGLGTTSPDQELEIVADTPAIRFFGTSATQIWDLNMNGAGRLNWNLDGDTKMRLGDDLASNLFNVGFNAAGTADADRVHVNGDITATGTITPDYVFESDYALESIEDHADFMWREKHLPAVGPGQVNAEGKGVINLTTRAQGVLEELEKAHIYIEQLHESLKALEARVVAVEDPNDP